MWRSLAALAAVAGATALASVAGLNAVSAGFLFLVTVLVLATWLGLAAGVCGSIVATLCFNYFFLPPIGTLHIADRDNWVALGSFLLASIIVSRLVGAARARADEAESSLRQVRALAAERERLLGERARLVALQESDLLKTALLRAVSHDLSTPLTAIGLHLVALERAVGQEGEGAAALARLSEESHRLQRRIENLLAMARLEAGHFQPRREPTPPADLFRAAREHLGQLASPGLRVRVDADCPDLDVDPSLVVEVLTNLIENALRASPAGAPVELRARRGASEGGAPARVWLEVSDQGPGVVGTNAASAAGDGAPRRGLGLEIARSFAAAHGGGLALLPRLPSGVCARVELPAAPSALAADAAS